MKDFRESNSPSRKIDKRLYSAIKIFKNQLKFEGSKILINDEEREVVIRNRGKPTNEFREERYLYSGKNVPIKRGDIVTYLNEKYIVITDITRDNPVYNICKLLKATKKLYWLSPSRESYSSYMVDVNATKYCNGVYENKDLRVGDTRIEITFPENKYTKTIQIGQRFLLDETHAYEVTDTGVASPKGLRIMILSQTPIYHEVDNLDLMIADYKGKSHDYRIEILNKNVILNKDNTCQLRIKIHDNKELIENPNIQYNVVDENIATVDENGLIKGISEGRTSVIVTFKNVQEEIKVQVIKDDVDNYTCEIIGSDKIAINRKKEYIAKFYKNGVEIEDAPLWEVTNEGNDKTNYAKCVNIEGNKCTIRATSKWIFGDGKSKYVYIHLKGTTGKEKIKKVKITSY